MEIESETKTIIYKVKNGSNTATINFTDRKFLYCEYTLKIIGNCDLDDWKFLGEVSDFILRKSRIFAEKSKESF